MLDRVVAVELVADVISKVVRPYMKEHNLSQDKLLYHYIGVSSLVSKQLVLQVIMCKSLAHALHEYIIDSDVYCRI